MIANRYSLHKPFIHILSLAWLLGLVAIFTISPVHKSSLVHTDQQDLVKEISLPGLEFRSQNAASKVPPFKIDWSLFGRLNPDLAGSFLSIPQSTLSKPHWAEPKALLDLFQFFIQFFYTW